MKPKFKAFRITPAFFTICLGMSVAGIHSVQADTWNGGTGKFEDPTAWGLGTVPASSAQQTFVLDNDGANCTADAATWTYLTTNGLLNSATVYRGVNRGLWGNTAGTKTMSFTLDIGHGNMFQMVTNADNWVGEKDGNDMTLNIISGTLQTGKRLRLAGTDTANGTVNVSGGRLEVGRDELILGTTSVTGPDPLLSMTGGALAVRASMLLRSGTFEVQGSNVAEISFGYGGVDGGATVEANGTIRAMVDAGGVTPIVVNDQSGDGIAGAVTFNAGSELDVGFLGIPDTAGTWTVLERQGGPITNNGLALTSAAITAGWNLQIDNSGVNGLLKVSFGIAPPGPEVFWDGGVSNDWDEVTLNWFDAGGVSTVAYADNSPVTFDNLRSNDGTVNLTTDLSPASISVIDELDYAFTGIGSITGAAGITKSGTSTLNLNNTGVSDFTGDVNMTDGAIVLGSATAFGASSGGVAIIAGTLDLGGFGVTKSDVAVVTGTVTNGTLTSNSVSVSDAATIDAVLAGASATLAKAGSGTLDLNGANTYDGDTTITGGTVILGSATALGSTTGSTSLNGGTLDLNGQTIAENFTQVSATIINSDTVNPAEITVEIKDDIGNPTFDGPGDITTDDITKTGTGTRRIFKRGSGTLTLGGDESNNRFGLSVFEGDVNLAKTAGAVLGRFNLVVESEDGGVTVPGTVRLLNSDQIHTVNDENGIHRIEAGTFDLNGFDEGIGSISSTETVGVVTNSDGVTTSNLTLAGTQTGGIPNDVDFSGTISGNLNLIKSGLANVQTLSGVVSHAGNTTINAGTLEISNAASDLNDASVVTITDGILNLSNGVTDTVNELWLDGGQVEAGTYGASGSGAANIDDVHFAGTGVLDVTTGDPVVDDYATWAAIYSPADLTDMTGDNDNDGLDNQTEYAFGLSPVSGSSVNPYIAADLSGGTFTYQRRSTTGLTYTIETSTDLAIWIPDLTAVQDTPIDIGGGNESVLVTPTGPLPSTKLFVRVKAD